jgi:hypothetical protein
MLFGQKCHERSPNNRIPSAQCPRVGHLSASLGAAIFGFVCLGMSIATASAAECSPHCDYNHYYGPYDFSYIRPGLYAYPVCGLRGNCAPYLVYRNSGLPSGNIIVSFPRRPRTAPPR